MLHVAAVGQCVANDDIDIVTKGVSVASQECLLSCSNKGSGALERFLHVKLDFLSGEGLESIVEVDPFCVLASSIESDADVHTGLHVTLRCDEGLPNGDVDRVLRYKLHQNSSCGMKRRVPNYVDV